MARWLLVRRRRGDGELAFYACFGPTGTSLLGLVRVAGTRWAVEEGFQQANGEVGLDHYQIAPLAGLVPARHVGAAGARVPGRHRAQAQASNGDRPKGGAAA